MKHYTDNDLVDYLHGELSDSLDARIHAHLAECLDCRGRFETEASVGDMLRSLPLAQERELPAVLKAQVWAAIRDAQPSMLERLGGVFKPIFAVPLAAALAVLMYFAVPVVRGPSATGIPTVSALYYLEEHAAEGQENPLADRLNTNSTLATQPSGTLATIPLVEAADAATLDDLVATRR